jgi:hypothetical protein
MVLSVCIRIQDPDNVVILSPSVSRLPPPTVSGTHSLPALLSMGLRGERGGFHPAFPSGEMLYSEGLLEEKRVDAASALLHR